MKEQFIRTAGLIGETAVARLSAARVAVFGIGGVGGHTVEALVRAGVGSLDLVDNDTVSESNINRQIIALHSTVGRAKTEVMAERARDINPDVKITTHNTFFLPENANTFDFSRYDYVVDAIDTVAAKMELVRRANAAGTPIISAMGTGNKLDPTAFRVTDIYKTEGCPLARTVRGLCRKEGIQKLKVVYSPEAPRGTTYSEGGRHAPASISFVPAAAGLLIAGTVIKDLCEIKS
ncbi:MAG: tRNA threonylcarbamoyladenosine dehydratase [Clostridia bacterium]|nr:tRNA threonylcarbamoyladenosine dehydratase [Clostridia bacterium]